MLLLPLVDVEAEIEFDVEVYYLYTQKIISRLTIRIYPLSIPHRRGDILIFFRYFFYINIFFSLFLFFLQFNIKIIIIYIIFIKIFQN